MVSELASKGVKVPNGFAITADALRHFIREARIDERIRATLAVLQASRRPVLVVCPPAE